MHTHTLRFLSASIDLNSSEDYKGILACSFFVEHYSLQIASSAHLKSSKFALKVKRHFFHVKILSFVGLMRYKGPQRLTSSKCVNAVVLWCSKASIAISVAHILMFKRFGVRMFCIIK